MKECTKCGQSKELTEFSKNVRAADGLQYDCKPCSNAYGKAYRENPTEDRTEYLKAYNKDNRDTIRNRQLIKKYGLTLAAYNIMHKVQGGCCALCGVEEKHVPYKRLCVDHCHFSGNIRALLCTHCNVGMGMFKDNPTLMRAAADFAEAHAPTQAT